ncbi:MAG: UbiX family flavin prenyltransferase [Rhodospirillales bacterium]|jgi:4-hydroxy-3-polyprenylbenzoate decarboxylase|nr:UbiX family flavin prenyltransferase [Rhodospirillales bacterium]MBT4007188.1 UbiX family flavin prenyltransferase [Rhodospirillales bacterium]MBT5076813.1 UbiX family flavin prenyltransferase [Rhodospirillales bacterium]MBT5113521.1 UbiX family flavin prenyltransferase [Rhodospirillales bacterium]MBT5673819.1 UbiX family flavin prenyltransferase [Rhodospirillales bacterium]
MRRIVIGMSGASGAIYGIRMLEVLKHADDVETHLILSPSTGQTISDETDMTVTEVKDLADVVYNYKDIGASLSSGSYRHDGMLVAPCSVKTLSGIVNSYDDNLLTRAADVALKEKRRVVLMVRETPLHLGHLELMARASRYGAVVMPPVPAFYHRPQTIDDIVNQSVGKALDLFDISHTLFKRWKETENTA